ncbi:AAA family ATPase [Succinivibrio sp.]|uniref:AAA family ATPase n=1 Tax=Succinivibrio sp. TaxID=2053619 RepID=UPI00258B132B|nr:AAA family ATPase [Succinivibrio sp.]MDD6206012.1 AAA family ATPase [Succinivibrio sp.]
MTEKTFKPLPLGNEDFVSLRNKGHYYVDKTPYLKKVFTDPSSVLLFTRPRRFGKTLLMDMFATYLTIGKDGSDNREYKEKLFDGLEILKDKEFTNKYMGQFPVIFISLKKVYGETFKEAYGKLIELVAELCGNFSILKESSKLSIEDKKVLSILRDQVNLLNPDYKFILTGALNTLSNFLYKHYGKKVILLIDEYDVPLAKASEKGYHDEMVTLISQFFDVMKITPNNKNTEYPIEKIVLTGCLKVAKNSIFTGVNNITVNTVLSENSSFDSIIGFTKEETIQFLKDYELEEYTTLVKENYDGYRFNEKEMFCPWDVVNFIAESLDKISSGKTILPGNYWINSTSSNALLSYVGYLTDKATDKMQSLMDGLSIETYINDSMNYDTLSKHEEIDFFSLLLHTGYLTSDGYRVVNEETGRPKAVYSLRIPNLEIRECFEANILQHFKESSTQGENKAMLIANALFEGDCETASDKIYDLLLNYVSVRDFATKAKPENYYHGFLSGVFTNCSDSISDYQSNSESGDGYADITFLDRRKKKAVILELKTAQSSKNLKETALQAIKQIEDKRYAEEFFDDVISDIYCYGISFYQKNCYIEVKKIK